MSVTDLNQTVRLMCHIVDVCSKLHNNFLDYCLFNRSDPLDVGIVFLLPVEKLQKQTFALQHDIKQYFCVEESLN